MKIPNPKFPTRNESPGIPEDARWIDDYSSPRDGNVKMITQALQKQLSFGDNVNAEIRELEILHDTDFVLTLQSLRGIPIGALVLWTELYDYHFLRFSVVDTKRVRFSVFFLSEPTEKSRVRILFVGP